MLDPAFKTLLIFFAMKTDAKTLFASNRRAASSAQLAQPKQQKQEVEPQHRNFLFILSRTPSEDEQTMIGKLAGSLTDLGYVYVARRDQSSMEDKDGVRYLPFRETHLPSFGLVTAVFVLGDTDVAQMAADEYPDSQTYLLEIPNATSAVQAATHEVAVTAAKCLMSLPLLSMSTPHEATGLRAEAE